MIETKKFSVFVLAMMAGVGAAMTLKQARVRDRASANQLIMVSQKHCPPCERMKPIMRRLQSEGYDANIVDYGEYQGDEEVRVTPTLLFYQDRKLVFRWEGTLTYRQITDFLEKPDAFKK